MRRKITNLLVAFAACALVATPIHPASAEGGEKPDYHAVVALVESHYHVKHQGIPFLANASVKTAKIASSTVRKYSRFADLKLAVFEDQDFAQGDHTAFRARMRQMLEPRWTPLVVVSGRDEGQTYTYTREDNGKFKVIVCVIGERDGTVLEVGLNEQEFLKLLSDPERETKNITDSATSQGDDRDK